MHLSSTLLFALMALACACAGPSEIARGPATHGARMQPVEVESDPTEPEPVASSEPATEGWCESLGSPWTHSNGLALQPATRFEFDSNTLSAESEQTLRDACEELAGRAPAIEAEVVMTPSREATSRDLPRERAEALAAYLQSLTCAPEVHVAVRYYESPNPQETTVTYRIPECD